MIHSNVNFFSLKNTFLCHKLYWVWAAVIWGSLKILENIMFPVLSLSLAYWFFLHSLQDRKVIYSYGKTSSPHVSLLSTAGLAEIVWLCKYKIRLLQEWFMTESIKITSFYFITQNKSLVNLFCSWSLICRMFTFILLMYFKESNKYVALDPKIRI